MKKIHKEEARQKIELIDRYIGGIDFNEIQIENTQDVMSVEAVIRDLYDKNRELEKLKRSITTPLEQAKRATNKIFKPAQQMIDNAIRIMKQKLILFENEQIEIAEVKQEAPKTQTTFQKRQKLMWKVSNIEKVPDRFIKYVINEEAINEELKKQGENLQIPGIEIYWKETLAIT